MTMPLFTSLPARLRGEPITPSSATALQRVLVETWHDAGFTPVSINTVIEHKHHPGLRDGITALGVQPCDVVRATAGGGVCLTPRQDHLCNFRDFLTTIHEHSPTGSVAIVNADIGLFPSVRWHHVARATAAEGFCIGQRLDVDVLPHAGKAPIGAMDLHGFDFVAFPAELIPAILDLMPEVLHFGMPWWDHYLPLSLLVLGLRTQLVCPGSLWHVAHTDRWSMVRYTQSGLLAARQFAASIRRAPETAASRAWLQLYARRFGLAAAVSRRDRLMRRLIAASAAPAFAIRSRLGVLAGGNVSLLLQAAAAGNCQA